MLKKLVVGVIALGVLFGVATYVDNTSIDYSLECNLYSVEENIITVEDKEGNLWSYESDNIPGGFDTIYLNMNDNNTEEIEDDEIKAVIVKK